MAEIPPRGALAFLDFLVRYALRLASELVNSLLLYFDGETFKQETAC
jgi:hypothetical protein